MTENEVKTIHIYNKNVIGCKKFKAAAMISLQVEGSDSIHDLFLNADQLKCLQGEIDRVVEYNDIN